MLTEKKEILKRLVDIQSGVQCSDLVSERIPRPPPQLPTTVVNNKSATISVLSLPPNKKSNSNNWEICSNASSASHATFSSRASNRRLSWASSKSFVPKLVLPPVSERK